MSYLGGYRSVGDCCTNAQMEQYGRTGTAPDNITDMLSFSKALKDSSKAKIYNDAKAAAVKVSAAKGQTAVTKAQTEAFRTGQAATEQASSIPMTTWLLVGGGLAVLAAVLVFKKKRATP